jgi:hypothetical protein
VVYDARAGAGGRRACGAGWIAAFLGLAFYLDGQLPWRYGVAITALFVLNFALLFAALTLLPNNWGMLWFAPFLWFGYRLADVIGDRAMHK